MELNLPAQRILNLKSAQLAKQSPKAEERGRHMGQGRGLGTIEDT